MTLHNINTIARYEVKLLKRSWLFRIFAVLALLGITFFLLAYQTTTFESYSEKWPRIAVSSLMPFCDTYFYNIAQSVIVIFLAGSFLKRDKKLDTAEVIYVRPMSNADYIIGKTWGIVKVFLSLNIISLAITAFLNLFITRSPFSLFPYLFYLLTISLPSLLFVLGLSFTVMCLLKNQAVTFIVMLGIIGVVFFYLSDRLYGIFDFFGVSIPGIFSDVTGHANLPTFLTQRLVYLLAGTGLISFTIALVKRLPHKPWKIIIVHTIGATFILAAAVTATLYVTRYNHRLEQRSIYAQSFDKYATLPNATVLTHDVEVTPGHHQLQGRSMIKIVNRHGQPLEKIYFYLNPALQVISIEENGQAIPFTHENQVITANKKMAANEEITLQLTYQGDIDEAVCYTDVPEKEYLDNTVPEAFHQFGKRYAWLEKDFTLLTPECLWYPVTVAPVYPAAPYNVRKNFTDFTLTVNSSDDKTILSQGNSRYENGKTIFSNPTLLPGISLTIADYEKKSIEVDSTVYEILYFRGHDYFSSYFTDLQDTLPGLLRELKNSIEIDKGRDYSFPKFVIAETPVQFATYVRNWKGFTEYVMPGIVFLPERGATLNFDLAASKSRIERWGSRNQNAPDETEKAINLFYQMTWNVLRAEKSHNGRNWENETVNKYNINPMFFAHTGFVYSDRYPVIDIVLNTMQTVVTEAGFRPWGGNIINNQQRANLYLENHSFENALSDREIKPEIFFELLQLKSKALKNYISTLLPAEELNAFLKDFSARHQFADISLSVFTEEFETATGVDLSEFIEEWYTVDHSPSIYLQEADANQVVIEEQTKYQVRIKAHNPSDVDAILTTQVQQGGNSRGRGYSYSQNDAETWLIPAGEAREIKMIVDERPSSLTVNTNISHNLPTAHTFNFPKIDNTTDDTLTGAFPVSPAEFKPNPNEIIIDNEDGGFRTIAANSRTKLKEIFQKKEEDKYKNFSPWRTPSKWTAIAADFCYGETVNSAIYKKKGSGNNSAEWKAQLPRDSYYEVFIWNPKMSGRYNYGRRGRNNERNQTYTLQYDQGKEVITLDLEREEPGWVSLGNFYMPAGTATITLSDNVSGEYIIADAVKFTRINN